MYGFSVHSHGPVVKVNDLDRLPQRSIVGVTSRKAYVSEQFLNGTSAHKRPFHAIKGWKLKGIKNLLQRLRNLMKYHRLSCTKSCITDYKLLCIVTEFPFCLVAY